jgi:hypothetical protein
LLAAMQSSNWSASDARWTASSCLLPKLAMCLINQLACLFFSHMRSLASNAWH